MKSVSVTPTAGAKSEVLSLPGLFIVVQTSQSRVVPAKKKAKVKKAKTAKPKKAASASATKVKKTAGKKKPHTASAKKTVTAAAAPAIPKRELDQARALRQGLADIKKFLKK